MNSHAPTNPSPATTPDILIVDDEAAIRKTMTSYLTRVGYHVTAASNGREALDMCTRQTFAVVVTDLKMPTMGGEELLEGIKACTPTTDIIVTTAYPTVESAIRTLKAGAYDYILKPFQLADVEHVLHRCLERRRLQQDLHVERHKRAELQQFSLAVRHAQEQERRRIARDLHDSVAQLLVGVRLHLDFADAALEGATLARAQLEQGRILLTQALQEVRDVAWTLRPTVLDDIGLASALEDLTTNLAQRTAVQITLQLAPDLPPLPAMVETALYRITQEALSNSLHHAQASHVAVQLRGHHDTVQLIITDDGCGMAPERQNAGEVGDDFRLPQGEQRGLGLWSMRERAREIGGTCTVHSSLGHGTEIQVSVPLTFVTDNGQHDEHKANRSAR